MNANWPCRKECENRSESASSSKPSDGPHMSSLSDDELKRREEQKRERHWDPVERWLVLQETITWAESQATVRRNTPARCLELQRAKLAPPPGIAPGDRI